MALQDAREGLALVGCRAAEVNGPRRVASTIAVLSSGITTRRRKIDQQHDRKAVLQTLTSDRESRDQSPSQLPCVGRNGAVLEAKSASLSAATEQIYAPALGPEAEMFS